MPFDPMRLLHQHVTVRDRTGKEYEGFVKEINEDVYVLANGDGTSVILSRSEGNVVSVRVQWRTGK